MRFDFNTVFASPGWQRFRRLAPQALGVALLVMAAWQAAALTWSAIRLATDKPALPPPAKLDIAVPEGSDRLSIDAVASMHLFGVAESTPATLQAAAANAPETRLNLKLRGILAADEAALSRAIISSGNQDKVYAVGDTLPGGAAVEAVLADKVLLRRAGRLETLRLPRNDAESGIAYSEPEPPADVTADRAELEQMRDELVNDPTRLSELVRYSPVLQDGEIRGYRLYPGRDRAKFAQLGLQPGDIVTAINGTPLSDPGRTVEMLNTLTDQSNITLTVERNGSPQDITLSPSQ